MGWNQLRFGQPSDLLRGLDERSYVYFVHSYYCDAADESVTIASVDYGIEYAAAIQRDNIYGVQFHPEKSQSVGLQILANFLSV